MDSFLQQGVMAAKAGDKSRASNIPENSEQAWLWLSSVGSDDSKRLYCLESALQIQTPSRFKRRRLDSY